MAAVTTKAVAQDEVKWREVYGTVVASASQSLRRGSVGIATAKASIIDLLSMEPADGKEEKPWQSFIIRNGDGSLLVDTTGNPHKTFREFIEAPPLRGLGEKVADIERLLADEPEALARLREELTAPRGNPTGVNQYSGNGNNVTISKEDDLFDPPPAKERKPSTPERGNRKDYTLTRLKKDAPELFEEVKAGRLSANAAALQAGFRRPMRSIPVDSPENAVQALVRVFEPVAIVRHLLPLIPKDSRDVADLARDVLLSLTDEEVADLLADANVRRVLGHGDLAA